MAYIKTDLIVLAAARVKNKKVPKMLKFRKFGDFLEYTM
jgi:hypothetical protein